MKKNLLWISLGVIAILTVIVLLPSLLVVLWPSSEPTTAVSGVVELVAEPDDVQVSVYLTAEKEIVKMPLEKYVRGVVAAEMPVTFEPEALRAQAIAARTYVVRRMKLGAKTEEGADVTDHHSTGQQYSGDEKLQQRWGLLDYPKNLSKVNEAVNETRGQILLYEGQPIEALFFSTSSGRTVNSEDYFEKKIPYLRSVESPWDLRSEKYEGTTEMTLREFREKLGVEAVVTAANVNALLQPLERTSTDHLKKVQVGDLTLTGAQLRAKLGLRSTLFTTEISGDKILFRSKGFGHGVGLSQYGANGMAKEGRKAKEILLHYYTGIEIGSVQDVLQKG